ncbi:hypothetical protein D3C79_700800 [compost metagenome]
MYRITALPTISDPDSAIFQLLHRAHGRICQQPVISFQQMVIKRNPSHADVQVQKAFVHGRKAEIGGSLKRQSSAIWNIVGFKMRSSVRHTCCVHTAMHQLQMTAEAKDCRT